MGLGKSTENRTRLENVRYENVRSDKLSKADIFFNTKSTSPSTGNASNSILNDHCYMAEEVHVKPTKIPQSRN